MTELWAFLAPQPAHAAVLVAAFLAGLVRGFAGFGAAMVFIPVTAAAISPVFAVCSLQVMDTPPTLPLMWKAVRFAEWRRIVPLFMVAILSVPLGVLALKYADPGVMRWGFSLLIGAIVAALASGWRMNREPRLPETLGIGGLAGFLSGSSGMSGPPVILFYLSRAASPHVVRANLILFLGAMTVLSVTNLAFSGLFRLEHAVWGLIFVIPYSIGILIGVRLFGKASERTFRRVAYAVILGAALVGLPLFDGLLR